MKTSRDSQVSGPDRQILGNGRRAAGRLLADCDTGLMLAYIAHTSQPWQRGHSLESNSWKVIQDPFQTAYLNTIPYCKEHLAQVVQQITCGI